MLNVCHKHSLSKLRKHSINIFALVRYIPKTQSAGKPQCGVKFCRKETAWIIQYIEDLNLETNK